MNRFHLLFLIVFPVFFGCKKESFEENSKYSIQISKLRNGYLVARNEIFKANNSNVSSFSNRVGDFYNVNTAANFSSVRARFLTMRKTFLLEGPYLYGNDLLELPGNQVYSRIDSYPINMEYIDYTSSNPNSGIISDAVNYPNITEFNIKSWDKVGGSMNNSCGMHVIEFLLWGEDLTLGNTGNRPVADFMDLRRRKYLNFASIGLKNDMQFLRDQSSLEKQLLSANPTDAFDFMMTGLLKFVKDDFAMNGIKKPLDSQLQADEISQFSDQTKEDLLGKLNALRLFYNPRSLFTSSSEYFLIDFVQEVDPDLNAEILQKMDKIEVKLLNVTVDFDQAILNTVYRQDLMEVYTDLINIHDKLDAFSQKIID